MARGKLKPAALHAQVVGLAAGATIDLGLEVGAFETVISSMMILSDVAANGIRVNLVDNDGVAMFSNRLPDQMVGALAGSPFYMDGGPGIKPATAGWVLKKNTTVTAQIENTTAGVATVDVALVGFERR